MRLSILFLFTFATLVAAQDPIVPKDAELEKLFTGIMLTEGVAVAPDGQVYFSDITFSHQSTLDNGQIHAGHIWRYDPTSGKTSIFRSPSGMSNGIKFDANGDMIVCEDGRGQDRIIGIKQDGSTYIIAENILNNSEFAGVNFSPDGQILFVNIYSPTKTIAITGPWKTLI